MAFGPADRDGTNQNKDRTWKGPPVKLWVTAPAATFPLSPVHQTGITIINGNLSCGADINLLKHNRPARHRMARATCPSTSTAPGSCPRIIADSHGKEGNHPPPQTRGRPVGRRVRRPRSWPPPSSTASTPPRPHHQVPRRILPKHTLTYEITRQPRTKETNRQHRPD